MNTSTTLSAHPPRHGSQSAMLQSGSPSQADCFISRALRRSQRTVTTVVPTFSFEATPPPGTTDTAVSAAVSAAQRAANADTLNRTAACDSVRRVRELVQAVDATYSTDYHRDALESSKATFLEFLDGQCQLRGQVIPGLGGAQQRGDADSGGASPAAGRSCSPCSPTGRVNMCFSDTATSPASAPLDLFVIDDTQARKMERTRRRASQGDAVLHQGDGPPGRDRTEAKEGASSSGASHRAQLEHLVQHSDTAKQRAAELLSRVSVLEGMLNDRLAAEQSASSPSRSSATSAVTSPGALSTEQGLKQLRQVVEGVSRAARSVYDTVDGTVELLGAMEASIEARDVSIGPVEAMLRLAKEELLFARQQRDEAKRELMLHRACVKLRANVRRGRDQRGEEYALIGANQQVETRHSIGGRAASLLVSPPQRGLLEPSARGGDVMLDHGMSGGAGGELVAAAGNVRNPHSAVAGLTPALRLQGAAMARNAFRTVPPRKGASAGDVERAEAELTHCIANVDVIFATCVHVAISDYDLLWHASPFVMQHAVRVFNRVVDDVAGRFDKSSALVYRSRGSVPFAPHGGYHMIVFRHPHEAVRFSAMLHCALLLAPWPQQLVEPVDEGDCGAVGDAVDDSGCTAHDDQRRYHRDSYATRCAASTVFYDPASMAATVANNSRNGVLNSAMQTAATSVEPPLSELSTSYHHRYPAGRSPRDMLIKSLEQFQMRHELATPTPAVMEYGEALTIAERLCAHVAIGPARVHALFAQPLLFRGLRAKVGMHTGIVFVEGSIRSAQPIGPEEEAEPDDVAYSFRPAFGRSSVQTSDGPTARRRGSTADAMPSSTSDGDKSNAQSEDDAFYGTVNAKVPLIYGAAVMKSSLLCGSASGGETVVSQQTYHVVSGALDAWGIYSRSVTYAGSNAASAQSSKTSVPVVNDLEYALFEAGEVAYQLLPVRFLQRALFFPETGACDVYNATWWLPFNPRSELSSNRMLQLHGTPMSLTGWYGARASPIDTAYFAARVHELEQRQTTTGTFVALARQRATRGALYREAQERCTMAQHDACVAVHWVNLMSDVLRDQQLVRADHHSATAAPPPKLLHRPIEALSLALEALRHPPTLAGRLHPGGAPTYSEVLLTIPHAQALLRYLSNTLHGADAPTVDALRNHVAGALNDQRVSPSKYQREGQQRAQQAAPESDAGSQMRLVPTLLWTFASHGLAGYARQLLQFLSARRPTSASACGPNGAAPNSNSALCELKAFTTFLHAQIEGLWVHADNISATTPNLSHCFSVLTAVSLVCQFALSHYRRVATSNPLSTDGDDVTPPRALVGLTQPHTDPIVLDHNGNATVSAWNHYAHAHAVRMRLVASSVARCPTLSALVDAVSGFMVSPAQWLEDHGTLLIVDPSHLLDDVLADLQRGSASPQHGGSREVSSSSAGVLNATTSPLLGRPQSSVSPATGTLQPQGHASTVAKDAAVFDDKRLENDQRLLRASSVSDFRSWVYTRPLTAVEASLEVLQHHSTPGTFLGFTVYAAHPEFPFGALCNPHNNAFNEGGGGSRQGPAAIRAAARDVLHHMAVNYATARRVCRFIMPTIGHMEHDQRGRQGGGPVPTVVVVMPEYNSAVGGCLRAAMSSVGHIQARAATSPQYSLSASALGMWHARHVESWGFSVALALHALHRLKAASGFVSPWTVLVPCSAPADQDATTPRLGDAAYLMENANLVLWKLTTSRTAGQDSIAVDESERAEVTDNNHATPRQHPSLDLAEWMAPELLAAAAAVSEQGDNPTQYVSHLLASVVSGAAYGSVHRGPFDVPLDAQALDVWSLGLLLWYLATSGTSPYTILKQQAASTPRASTQGTALLTRASCEQLLSLIRVDEPTTRSSFVAAAAVSPSTPGLSNAMAAPQSPARQFSIAHSLHLSPTTMLLDASQRIDQPLAATSNNIVTTNNLFGSIGNLMRHLRLCLETKKGRRLAPYAVGALWPTATHAADAIDPPAAPDGSDGTPDSAHPASSAFQQSVDAIDCTSLVLLCDLLHRMLQVSPAHRITIDEALKHPYFLQVPTRVADDGAMDVAVPEYIGMTRHKHESRSDSTKGLRSVVSSQTLAQPGAYRGVPLVDVGMASGMNTAAPHHGGLFADALPERGATLVQVLPADYALGTPFVAHPLAPATGGRLHADALAEGSIELLHATIPSGGTTTALSISSVIGEMKKRNGIALVPIDTDPIAQTRLAAAREVVRRDALVDRRAENGVLSKDNGAIPLSEALSSTMSQLLGL